MSLDNITKEQFQLYKQVQEKEKELQHYKENRMTSYYGGPLTSGILTVAFTVLATTTWPLGLPMNAMFGFAALGCAAGTYKLIKYDIPKNKKTISDLEKELEGLKSQPEYRALE